MGERNRDDDLDAFLAGLGARVKAARLAKGMSYREACDAAGVSLSTLQRAESGETDTAVGVLYRLATVYGVTLPIPPGDAAPAPKGKGGRAKK